MAARKVTQVFVTYKDADGNWQTAMRGEDITVHADDLKRVEKSGAFDKVKAPEES